MSDPSATESPDSSSDDLERRFPRRLLITAGAAATAVGAADLLRPGPADAAASTTWLTAGNDGVTASNYVGTKNVAALIFKTSSVANTPVERLRITPGGHLLVNGAADEAVIGARAGTDTVLKVTSVSTNYAKSGIEVATTNATGITAKSTDNIGVSGTGSTYGVSGTGQYGLYGNGSINGVYGYGNVGLYGYGTNRGVYGYGANQGVYGSAPATGGTAAVYGNGGQYGVQGASTVTAGVRGDCSYVGVWGQGANWGVYGLSTATSGQNYGVYGQASVGTSYGVFSNGNMHVNGTLSKTAGSFKIDHPLDPERKWLSHSFVESPDMMNVYNGNVVLDAHGKATIKLPSYFESLNRDFRYQLTCVGGHAPVYVSRKVQKGSFSIAGGTKGLEVSWQVTGIRQDDYAKAHPIVVETDKTDDEVGTRAFVPKGMRAQRWSPTPQVRAEAR